MTDRVLENIFLFRILKIKNMFNFVALALTEFAKCAAFY